MGECGEPDAISKALSITAQDRGLYNEEFIPVKSLLVTSEHAQEAGADYFEFKPPPTSKVGGNWASEFQNFNFKQAHRNEFPLAFEQAFAGISLATQQQQQPQHESPWVNEFKSSIENSNWINQFKSENSQETHESWVSEFKATKVDENVELRDTARSILSNLENDPDEKLAQSRFVAYLRDLAGFNDPFSAAGTTTTTDFTSVNQPHHHHQQDQPDFQTWKNTFLENVSHLSEDSEWKSQEKSWESYEASGYGYKSFAQREFGKYHFSIPIAANQYRQVPDKFQALEDFISKKDHRNTILVLEAIINEDETNAKAWSLLGQAQQANEVDPQAIAAFLRATALDPKNVDSWLGLAASCTNESCVPDALQALRQLLECQPEYNEFSSRELGNHLDIKIFTKLFDGLASNKPSKHVLVAASILHNLGGNHSRAAALLRSLVDTNDWTVLNRLGATLANSKQYQDAISIYEQLFTNGYHYPRVYYNHGISKMCLDQHDEAARSFVNAIDRQIPVDVVSNIKQELLTSFTAPWEALRVNFSIAGREDLANCNESRLMEIKSYLGMI